ncbi:hypothetical protein ACQKII_13775 [Lysinibacillus sp. NPDC048646]|uniref:hypothetical protein n=1 Tax=Lysinibacillus sp. NPDC048646 TaxID=3390574 RepID=UPI003D075228
MKKIITFFILCIVLLTGCTANAPAIEQAVWEPYVGTYIGDHLNVSKIAGTVFMLGDTIDQFDLRGEVLRVIYRTDNEALSKWFTSSTSREEAIVYNAMMATILVPNAKGYAFSIDGEMFELSREVLINEMESIFPTLPQGNDFFDGERVKAFLQKYEGTIQQYAVDTSYQNTFIKQFLITKSS